MEIGLDNVLHEARPRLLDPTLFVGRAHELRRVQLAFAAAVAGRGGVLLVAGEPGIGKTALCRELSVWATAQGGLALLGQCDDGGALSVPYLPFLEALRAAALAEDLVDQASLVRELTSGPSDLAHRVPDLRESRADLSASPSPDDPVEARYRLLQAVTAFLQRLATRMPVLLVLEDLQDADLGTLDLLVYLSRHIAEARLLVLGTYRDTEVDRSDPLARAIAAVRRRVSVDRLRLHGLTTDEVQHLVNGIAAQAGRVLPRGLATTVHAQTEGNPLFVWETMRQRLDADRFFWGRPLTRDDSDLDSSPGIPEGLTEVIGTRLARLSPPSQRLLTIAAVIGREFTLHTIQSVAGEADHAVAAALAEAERAAVLHEHARVGDVQYRWGHALFRQTLYADIPAAERRDLHARVAHVLEAQYGPRADEHAAELAEHFARSTDADDLSRALRYSRRAAAQATGVYAYGEAARLLDRALVVQEAVAGEDVALRCDLLIARGWSLNDAGEARRALDEVASRAFGLAEASGDADRASAACQLALGCLISIGSSHAVSTPEGALWAERADRWARPETAARVYADTFLGGLGYFRERWFDGIPLLTRALSLARRLDNPEVLWWAAYMWMAYAQAPQHADDQLRLIEEFASQPRTGVSTRTVSYVLMWIGAQFLCRGQRTRAEVVWRELEDLAARSGQPSVHLAVGRARATQAILAGRLEETVAVAQQLVDYGREVALPDHARILAGLVSQRALLHLGRYHEALRDTSTAPGRVLTLAHLGRVAEVRAHLDEFVLARESFGTDADETPGYMDVFRLEAAVLVGHRAAVTRLLGRLARPDVTTTGVRLPTCIARHLGSAAALLGRCDEARVFFQSALAQAQALRFRPEVALTCLGLAELLLTSYPDQHAEAVSYLDVALNELRELGMAPALAHALRLAAQVDVPTAQHGLTVREIEVLRLVADGKSNGEIAAALVVSIRTAERHVANIYTKLGVAGPVARASATAYAHTHGLVAPQVHQR